MSFGKIVQNLRLLCHPTLDRFCAESGFTSGWIEKIEAGDQAPLGDDEILELARALALREHSRNWVRFIRLAPSARVGRS